MATTYYGETDRTRGVLTYSTSQTDTQVTLTAKTQLQAKSYGYSGYRLNTKFDGTTVATKLGYVPGIYTSWTNAIETSEYSKNYTRTHSAQSVVVKSEYYGEGTGDYYAGGKSGETSVTITIPAKPSYSISYNANGGSGAPSSQTKWYGETLTLQSGTPTRTNYLFKGWATSSTATTATYSAGGSYTTNAAATLYAVWELNGYTISYNLNGGSGSFADQTKIYGQTLTLRTGSPTKASSSAGSYTITYNANSGSVSPTSATASRTTAYTFSKWNTKQDGSGTNYNAGASYTANAAAVLYAQYTSSTSTASVKLPTPTRSNYTFTGWYTASSGGTKVGDAGANYTPTGTTTLYAHWTGVTYTITYNLNGGSGTFANQTKVYGETLTLRSGSPTKSSTSAGSYTVTYNANGGSVSTASATAARTTSYTFSKWNTKQDGSGTNYYSPDHLSYTTNAAATLYAQYTSSTTTAAITSFPTPTRSGYSFAGWFTAASGGTQKNTPFTPTSSTTLYAHWTAAQYTVSANLKGGSGTFNNLTKTQDVPLTLWTSSPTKTDYVFKGWDTSDAATTVVYSAGASYTENRGRTLYAVWQLNYSEPKITNVTAVRSNSSGTAQDDGIYVRVKCNWRTFSSNYNATKIEIHYKQTSEPSNWTLGYKNDSPGAYSGTLTQTIGGSISTSDTYDVRIRVTDQFGNGMYTTFVSTAFVGFDQGTEGKSLGFGMVASDTNIPTNGRLDVGMNTYWHGTTPMTIVSYGNASANAAFKFSRSSTDAGISPAFMIPAQTGSWSVGSRTDYDHLYFTYNDGGGATNDNTLRFYLSSSEGTKNNTYKILTAAAPVPVANGGTGQKTAKDAMNAFINSLDVGTSNSTSSDYIITQYAGGGTTNTTYYRRQLSKVLQSVSGLTVSQGGTGASTFTSGGLVTGNGTGALTAYTPAWQAWTAGTTAGPKAKIKLGNVDYESAAIPSASASASGIVTTGNQTFAGRKTIDLISPSIYDGTGNSSRYKHLYFRNNAGTFVGEVEYDSGDATNVSGGTFWFTEMSPKSTADTATTGHYEAYGLPTVTTGRTTDASYRIVTTKGGTMPARFSMYQSYQPYLIFKPSNSTNNGENTYGPASIWVNSGNSTYVNLNKMYFRLYSPSKDDSTTTTYTSYYDQFSLPGAETGKTSSNSYDILTTKNTVTIAQGGTGSTTRLGALKALTNENVSTNANYFLTITSSWGKGGYTSVADAKTVLGITGTQYGSNHMGWKKVSITLTNGAGSVACTGVTADSVVQVTRVGTYSDTSGGYSTHIGAAATNAGNVKVFSTASGTVTWNVYIWWSKTATGG